MGLGGLTRDSIVGLNKLVHDDDDDDNVISHRRRHSGDTNTGGLNGSWNNGSNKGSEDYLFLQGEQDGLGTTESQGSFQTALNDGLAAASGSTTPSGAAAAPSSTPRSSAAVAAATSYSKASATNSRSLDSYRSQTTSTTKASSEGISGAQAPSLYQQGFQYEGYTDYYSDEFSSFNYDEYSYAGGSRGGGREKKNIFCCLFAPWMQPKVALESEEDLSVMTGQDLEQDDQDTAVATFSPPEKKASVESSTPEKVVMASPTLSQTPSLKEKIPVATSLGSGDMPAPTLHSKEPPSKLPPSGAKKTPVSKTVKIVSPQKEPAEKQPTTPHMMAGSVGSLCSEGTHDLSISPADALGFDEKKQEEGDILGGQETVEELDAQEDESEEDEGPPPVKSILKVRRCSMVSVKSISSLDKMKSKSKKGDKPDSSPNKRHLFPTYEPKKSHIPSGVGGQSGEPKSINFNPMARVLTIPSRKDIPLHQKAQVWWQKCDYDEFKKTGRIISKAMECGGSEIWLASSNAWGDRAARQTSSPREVNKSKKLERSDSQNEDEYKKALSKYVKDGSDSDNENSNDNGSKWWCKFGHSRRGLEHIASNQEGRARQQSVVLAIRMVMEEQKRQRISRTKDPNKLRNIAMQYTSWARDLALAGGSADAEAVSSNFNPSAASRAQHFAQRLNVNSNSRAHSLHQSDAGGTAFGACRVAMAVTSQILDANAHARTTPKTSQLKSSRDVNHEEDSLSRRAKGYIPGGNEIGFRSLKV